MQDVEIIGLLKTYVKQTLAGMGALKGAACQITSIVDSGTSHVITFFWEDNSGVTHTNTLTLVDGADEVDELKDISITNLQDGQVLSWDNTAKKWVNTANSSTVASINNIGDVTVTNVTNGQILEWDDTASKWVNASLGTAAKKDSTNAVTENSTDVVESGAVFTAIDDAVKALDVSDTAVAGSYVTEVSETDGKISVTREAADAAPTENSNKLVKSGGVYSAIDDAVKALDVSDTAVAGSYVTEVSETDGKISVTREAADAAPTENSNKLVKSGGVYSAIDDAVKALDVSDTAVAGSYVTEVSETDGKISVVREAADAAPTENSNKLVKSGGVYSADANIYAEMTRQGVKNILSQQFDEVMMTASLGNKATSANGLTLTYNSDGSIRINGTPTDSSKDVAIRFDWDTNNHPFDISYLAGKKIVVSISETEINGIKIIPGYFDASDVAHQYSGADITTKGEYTYSNDAKWARCYLSISGAYSYSDVTVYPMIYIPFEGATDDYAPPAKTNQELTADNQTLTNQVKDMNNVLGAKNLLPYPYNQTTKTANGVTFTVNDDGSITLNGTNTGNNTFFMINSRNDSNNAELFSKLKKLNTSFKLLGGVNSPLVTFEVDFYNSSNTYIGGVTNTNNTPTVFTIPSNAESIDVFIRCGANATYSNFTCYPMLYLASITDDTYEPYAKTNQQLTKEITGLIENKNVLGAKNLIPFPYQYTSGYQKNGITFTINDDNSITANGTFSAVAASFQLVNKSNEVSSKLVEYARKGAILSGGLGSGDTITFEWYDSNGQYLSSSSISNRGTVNVPTNAVYCNLILYLSKGSRTSVNETFYPMLTLPSETDFTYEPYAKGNLKLTKETTGLLDNVNKNGCKNLLKNYLTDIVQTDGTVTVSDTGVITVNGTVNLTEQNCVIHNKSIGAGDYILSDGSNNDINDNHYHRIYYRVGSGSATRLIGNAKITVSSSTILKLWIYIDPTTHGSYSNEKYYPMLRLASNPDDTYAPYAKTNRELTEIVDADHSIVETIHNEMNIFLTDDAVPSDWSNLTTQQATDITQALYDVFKNIGGSAGKRYSGSMICRYKKASDDSQLGTATGMVDIYSNVNYNSMLSNNADARFTMVFNPYGTTVQTIYALWGKNLMFSQHGIDTVGTVMDFDKKYIYNTISTYKG